MGFEIAIGARVRKSPYFEATVEDGVASFSAYNHTLMPTGYGDPEAEYWRLINGVSMWDVACERQVAIKGPDAEKLVRYLTTRNLRDVQAGQGRYVPLCNHKGTIINDPVLLPISETEFWLSIADSDIGLWASAVGAERGLDVEVTEPDVSPLAIQGPKGEDTVANLLGDWVRRIPYFGFEPAELEGIPMIVARSGWSKQEGFELYLMDGSKGVQLWNLVKEAGKPHEIGPGCPNAIERIESGLLSYGSDTDEETNPFECGLGKLVGLKREDDFIGKAALTRIKAEGIRRQLVGYNIEGEPQKGYQEKTTVMVDGETVGMVSSAAWSYRQKTNVGIGLIKTELSEAGQQVQVCHQDDVYDATVVQLPML